MDLRSERLVRRIAPVAVVLPLLVGTPRVHAAESCPNEARRAEDPYSLVLPDCRAYEQVSPVDKGFTDAVGSVSYVRSSPSGEALTFAADTPFPGGAGSIVIPHFLSTRGADEWSTQSLVPLTRPGATAEVVGVTEDLSYTLVSSGNEPPLSPGATEGINSLYLRNSATGAYTLLAQAAPGEVHEFYFVGAADDDSRIFFETAKRLLPAAPPGVTNLYEWHAGQLSLLDVLPPEGGMPSEAPPGGALAGPAIGGGGGVEGDYFTQGAISEGGTHAFFTDVETGRIYVREPQAGAGRTIPVSAGRAVWQAATSNGSQVFYTEGEELYRFDLEGEKREALTSGAAGVLGVLGLGHDGSYVYFAAKGALASGASEAKEHANLYLEHEGAISFIAELDYEGTAGDSWNWIQFTQTSEGPSGKGRSSRVSSNGQALLFTSKASLTGYANNGLTEIYLYSVESGRVSCVSCNPSGAPASSDAYLYIEMPGSNAARLEPEDLPRNLSEDGERVFFETAEALVPQAGDGQLNVYEWEAEGAGSCPSSGNGGCLYLISTGQSTEPSYFAEASANGNDVFFFTRQSLVGQDTDENIDVYDARVGGGIAAQNSPVPPMPCLGEACRPAQTPASALGVPVSQVFSGPGNLEPSLKSTPPPSPPVKKAIKCPKGKKLTHGKCGKARAKKKAKKPAKHGKKRS